MQHACTNRDDTAGACIHVYTYVQASLRVPCHVYLAIWRATTRTALLSALLRVVLHLYVAYMTGLCAPIMKREDECKPKVGIGCISAGSPFPACDDDMYAGSLSGMRSLDCI